MRAVLSLIGGLLLLLAVLLVLLLFIPVSYELFLEVRDPEGAEDLDPERLLNAAAARISLSLPGRLAALRISLPEGNGERIFASICGIPVRSRRGAEKESGRRRTKEKASAKEDGEGTFDWREIARDPKAPGTVLGILREVLRTMTRFLPRRCRLQGRFDLLDYEWNARLGEAFGVLEALTPVEADVEVLFTDRFLVNAGLQAEGRIRPVHILALVLRLLARKDVRRLLAKAGSRTSSKGMEQE